MNVGREERELPVHRMILAFCPTPTLPCPHPMPDLNHDRLS